MTHNSANTPHHTYYYRHTTTHIGLQTYHNTHNAAITASPPHHTLYCNDATSHITLPITLQHTYSQLYKTLQHITNSAKHTTAHIQLCKTHYSTQPTLQKTTTTKKTKNTLLHKHAILAISKVMGSLAHNTALSTLTLLSLSPCCFDVAAAGLL